MKTIGLIGCGNMSQAIISGMIKAHLVEPQHIIVSDINKINLEACHRKFGIQVTENNKEVASSADIIFLAVKPHLYPIINKEIKDVVSQDCIIVSIAAGQSFEKLKPQFQPNTKIVITMPNTPAMVNEGMTAVVFNEYITDSEKEDVKKILSGFGKVEIVTEALLAAVTAVSGSSPAYVFMLIEAMADTAVLGGMARTQAYTFAAQSVLGAAKMVLETGVHPAELKDNVCSPGGTTIEAVAELERTGFRNSIISAMKVCMEKFKKMSE